MENLNNIDLEKVLPDVIQNIEFFTKFNSLENPVSFLEFRADVHSVVSNLISLWNQLDLQTKLNKGSSRLYCELRDVIKKSLIDCNRRENQCFEGTIPEWEMIIQEEKLRKDLTRLFGNLAKKLKEIQGDTHLSKPRPQNKPNF
jgi:hypothetical protein